MTPRETELRSQLQECREALRQVRRENELLRQKLDALARRFFGKKSEQLDAAQLELLLSGLAQEKDETLNAAEGESPEEPPSRPRRSCGSQRVRTPEMLEVVRAVIEPELVLAEPAQWKRIGEEVSRQLDYQPGKFFWRETVRPKYVRVGKRALPPVVAPAPVRVAEHSLAAPGLLAQLLVGKYADHLPYYRQQQIFWQRYGVWIARQQMVAWTEQAVRLLSGITDCLKTQLRDQRYLQVDETPVRYLDPGGSGRCGQGYLWTALVPEKCVVYEWHASRASACLNSLLGDNFTGRIQCDGYSGYSSFAKDKPKVALLGCWAHTRRKLYEAIASSPRTAGWLLRQIQHLYRIEAGLREQRAGPQWRAVVRAQQSRPIVARIERALIRLKKSGRYLPQSLLGSALDYALNQWPALQRFVEHGEAEIDNNLVENAIRPTALGKKNWLFFGSAEAGQRSAVIYTLIGNCRMHGLEPYAYLKDMLERLPATTNQQVAELTPLRWKKARQSLAT